MTLTCPSISQRSLSRSNLAFRIANLVLRFPHPSARIYPSLTLSTDIALMPFDSSVDQPPSSSPLSLSPPIFTQTITPARYFSLPSRCSSSWTFRNYPPHPASCAHNNLLPCSASDRNPSSSFAGTLALRFGPVERSAWRDRLWRTFPARRGALLRGSLREMMVRTGFDSSRKLQHSVLGLASRL